MGAPLTVLEIVSEFETAAQIADKVRLFLGERRKEVCIIYPTRAGVGI